MSENNINNFQALIEQKRIVKKIIKNSMLAFGAPDRKAVSDYRPIGIMWEDLLAEIKAELGGGSPSDEYCNITLTPLVATLGTPVDFSKPDNTDLKDDIIPGVLTLARGSSQPLFNAITEVSYQIGSPGDTEWNSLYTDPSLNGFGDLTNLKSRTYDNFVASLDGFVGFNIIGLPLVCHVISTDQYFLFVFDEWTQGGVEGGAGFGYTRTEVFLTDPCVLTFSDGTTMDTAPVIPVNTNSWDMSNVAFVDINGDDLTAVTGDGNKPFSTFGSAFANSNYVWVNPGIYGATIDMPANAGEYFMHCPTGVEFRGAIRDVTNAGGRTLNVSGNAVFGSNSFGIQNVGAGTLNIECDKFDNVRTVLFNFSTGTINLTCNSVRANCFNGGAYAMSFRSTSKSHINVKQFFHSQHILADMRNSFSGELYFDCPDMRVIANYTSSYGTAAKYFSNIDNPLGAIVRINGEFRNTDATTPAAAAGVINLSNAISTPIKFKWTGDIDGGTGRCFTALFRAAFGDFVFDGNLKSASSPIYTALSGWGIAANLRLHVKNSLIEGFANVIGKGRQCYFTNCQIKHITGGPIFANDPSGITPQLVYTYNCSFESGGVSETFLGFDATTIVGCQNTLSTEVLGTSGVIDVIGGFNQNATIVVPTL